MTRYFCLLRWICLLICFIGVISEPDQKCPRDELENDFLSDNFHRNSISGGADGLEIGKLGRFSTVGYWAMAIPNSLADINVTLTLYGKERNLIFNNPFLNEEVLDQLDVAWKDGGATTILLGSFHWKIEREIMAAVATNLVDLGCDNVLLVDWSSKYEPELVFGVASINNYLQSIGDSRVIARIVAMLLQREHQPINGMRFICFAMGCTVMQLALAEMQQQSFDDGRTSFPVENPALIVAIAPVAVIVATPQLVRFTFFVWSDVNSIYL